MASSADPFRVDVEQRFGASRNLLHYLEGLDAKMKRGVIRKMVSAGGTTLSRAIRAEIARRDMPYSRGRNAAERRKARKTGKTPLRKTIKKRAYNKATRGLFGSVVGPSFPAGAHGHLANSGHRITGRARLRFRGVSLRGFGRGKWRRKQVRLGRKRIGRSGERTVAHHFQEDAMEKVDQQIYLNMAKAMGDFMRKQGIRRVR